MDQCLFIPCYNLMAKFAHIPEHIGAGIGDAFRKVYAPWKGSDLEMHFPARPNHRRKSMLGSNISQQELRIKFTDLIFHWDEQ